MDPGYAAYARTCAHRAALVPVRLAPPALGPREIRLRVHACGVCRTDLHLADGELPPRGLPRVPGHEIVGTVVERGAQAARHRLGERVGVPWLGLTCGECEACRRGLENLCAHARFTGWSHDGGYAEYAVAHEDYAFALPPAYDDEQAAPLLCAGLIGYRALGMVEPGSTRVGLYGFGAAAHLVAQVALQRGQQVCAFTRPGDAAAQALARSLGVAWAGGSDEAAPIALDAAILFAPAGELVPRALQAVRPGGRVICAGIHMSDIPSFPYRLLWQERSVRSVANLTRRDGLEFMAWAGAHRLQVATTGYALADANVALDDLRAGRIAGAAVLHCGAPA